MNYQDILGNCQQVTMQELTARYPQTLAVFRRFLPVVEHYQQTPVDSVATAAGVEPDTLRRELFDTVIEQTPLEELDTDVLVELVLQGYEIPHLREIPKLHRLARKIEAIHRAHPEVPKGITLAIKELEHGLKGHIEEESAQVLARMRQNQPSSNDQPLAQINNEHSAIKRQLRKLRAMTRNYRIPEAACRSWQRFYRELRDLDYRLSEQIYLERDILFPRFQR